MSILNLVQANQQWGYEIHSAQSFAGNVGTGASVTYPTIDLSQYDYGTDIFLSIEACTNTVIPTSAEDGAKGFQFDNQTYDASPNWDTATTNLVEIPAGVSSNVGIYFRMGNPLRPKIGNSATIAAIGDSDPSFGLSFRGSIHHLILRKKFAGQIGYVSNSSYLPLMRDDIIPTDGDPNGPALYGGITSIGSAPITGSFPSEPSVLPLSVNTKGYLVVAAAVTTNPSLQTIDWPFTGGEYYGPIFINNHYVLIKVLTIQVNEVYKTFPGTFSVNGGASIFGQVGAFLYRVNR